MKINPKAIEGLLAEQKMTKLVLSELSGVSRQTISVILKRGTCEPKTAGKIASGLGVTVDRIMEIR